MGGGLPVEPMSKGIMLSEMDQRINGWMRWSEWKKLEDLIRALKPISNAQDYLDTLVNHECMQRPVSAYLMTYWYDPHSQWCYWPGKDFIKITIEGKIKAFELALMHRLPLDSYWASLGRTDNDFRVIVAPSEQQITSILITPPPKVPLVQPGAMPRRRRPSKVPIWVIHRREAEQNVTIQNLQDMEIATQQEQGDFSIESASYPLKESDLPTSRIDFRF
jgi:hypothetical protein